MDQRKNSLFPLVQLRKSFIALLLSLSLFSAEMSRAGAPNCQRSLAKVQFSQTETLKTETAPSELAPVKAVSRAPMARNKDGFTLVELLVAVGIVSIVIGLLMPALSRAREQANRVRCLSNLRQLGTGILAYSQDNHGYFPETAVGWSESAQSSNNVHGVDWIGWPGDYRYLDGGAIAPYVGHPNPAMTGDSRITRAGVSGMDPNLFRCPSDDYMFRTATSFPGFPYNYSYSMNEMLGTGLGYQGTSGPVEQQVCAPKTTDVTYPSAVVMMMEENTRTIDDGNEQPNDYSNKDMADLSVRHSGLADKWVDTVTLTDPKYKGNVVFCDGSARSIPRIEAHTASHYVPRQ